MEKELFYVELFDIYKGLLTKKQRELFESHYIFDLSLSEIAEPEGRTRQSVYDAIKKVKKKLNEYEELLKVKATEEKLVDLSSNIRQKDSDVADKILEIIGK
jgi:predicted DNA-binding protein YlxM (UPF0122 family)